jgi:hypothetical protein
MTSTTAPITNATWYGQIRDMFTSEDLEHMARLGLDLASYSVVNLAGNIYQQVAAGNMPLRPWPPDRVGKRSHAKWCRELRATPCD